MQVRVGWLAQRAETVNATHPTAAIARHRPFPRGTPTGAAHWSHERPTTIVSALPSSMTNTVYGICAMPFSGLRKFSFTLVELMIVATVED